MNFQLILNRT